MYLNNREAYVVLLKAFLCLQ